RNSLRVPSPRNAPCATSPSFEAWSRVPPTTPSCVVLLAGSSSFNVPVTSTVYDAGGFWAAGPGSDGVSDVEDEQPETARDTPQIVRARTVFIVVFSRKAARELALERTIVIAI